MYTLINRNVLKKKKKEGPLAHCWPLSQSHSVWQINLNLLLLSMISDLITHHCALRCVFSNGKAQERAAELHNQTDAPISWVKNLKKQFYPYHSVGRDHGGLKYAIP